LQLTGKISDKLNFNSSLRLEYGRKTLPPLFSILERVSGRSWSQTSQRKRKFTSDCRIYFGL